MSGELKLRNLTKTFDDGKLVAVDNLSLTVRNGEFLVFVGPSGCGKSTTLRCIAGLEQTTDGSILLDGKDITDQRPQDRDIAMVFQDYALYPHMTAHQNIGFGLRMVSDLSREEIDERVEDIAAMMDIAELLDDQPPELSGGQQQRVALGRALIRDPDVFLMDEPLSNLDAKLRTKMRTEIQRLQQELDVTTIYVTHDQTEAMTMGDRIAVLKYGELQQCASPIDCYQNPKNKFVASFIGSPSMNFFDVTYEPETGIISGPSGFTFEVSADKQEQLSNYDGPLTLGVRPEGFTIARSESDAHITTTVELLEPHGDVTYLSTEYAGTEVTVAVHNHPETSDIPELQEGKPVHLKISKSMFCLFDPDTGESIVTMDTASAAAISLPSQ